MLYPTGSTNYAFTTPKINGVKQVMVMENSPKIFVQAKIRSIMSAIVNPGDMVDNTHS